MPAALCSSSAEAVPQKIPSGPLKFLQAHPDLVGLGQFLKSFIVRTVSAQDQLGGRGESKLATGFQQLDIGHGRLRIVVEQVA